jgi:hypothetical protein
MQAVTSEVKVTAEKLLAVACEQTEVVRGVTLCLNDDLTLGLNDDVISRVKVKVSGVTGIRGGGGGRVGEGLSTKTGVAP